MSKIKNSSTTLLKAVIVLIAVAVTAGMLWFPRTEGRAANLDVISIYTDPLIIYVYIASSPFFIGLYQAFKLLNLIDTNDAFSQKAVDTLKNMKYASLSLIGFIAFALIYIRFFVPPTQEDDPAGVMMLGMIMSLAFGVIAAATGVFQEFFQNAVDLKSENDLTV